MGLVMPRVTLTGSNWNKVVNLVGQDREVFRKEFRKIINREAKSWKEILEKGFDTGKFGDKKQPALEVSTTVTRMLHGNFSGYNIVSRRSPLVASGRLRDSLRLVEIEDDRGDPAVFVGWLDSDKRGELPNPGMSMADLVQILERGAKSKTILMNSATGQQMLPFLKKLYEADGLASDPDNFTAVTIRHRARPFLGPALREARRGIKSRMNKEISAFIQRMFNTPSKSSLAKRVKRTIERGRRQAFAKAGF